MSWYSRRFEAPQVRTYAQALEHYESAKPIRGNGKNGGKRPIGKRNGLAYTNKTDGDKIQFVLYKTPVLTYSPDDTIEIKLDGWISNTTATFISEVLNTTVYHRDSNLHLIHYTANKAAEETHIIQDGMTIKYTTDQHGQVDIHVQGSQPALVHRLNRQRWKEVRDTFKPFREYMKLMAALEPQFAHLDSCYAGHRARNLCTTSKEMSWQSDNQNCASFLIDVVKAQKAEGLEEMLELVRELALSNCPTQWRRVPKPNATLNDPIIYDYEITVTLKKEPLLKALDNILKHALSRELFVPEFLPEGKYTKDSNKKYVKYAPREVEYNKLKAVI